MPQKIENPFNRTTEYAPYQLFQKQVVNGCKPIIISKKLTYHLTRIKYDMSLINSDIYRPKAAIETLLSDLNLGLNSEYAVQKFLSSINTGE